MRWSVAIAAICGLVAVASAPAFAQPGGAPAQTPAPDPVKPLVARLDLERYKATIKGLTAFGDRRQGTDRNRAAVDWIETQLKSYGCSNTERVKYEYQPPAPRGAGPGGRGGAAGGGRGDTAQGGGRPRGVRARTGVNTDPNAQPDLKLRELNAQPTTAGEREEVYCTKIGTTHPDEMYIVSGHMDGHGWGEAANDDGSGTALVMELARVLNAPTCRRNGRSGSRSGTTRRPAPTGRGRTSNNASRCRDGKTRRDPAGIRSRNGSA